ncbi:MAG: carboxymethylenebutenolidase [Candidatus Azotimanducaceae bacterium]|jgi:carboxymethylenebutenolidase
MQTNLNYQIKTTFVDGNSMDVFLFSPRSEGTHPAVILCQHIPVGHAGLEHDTFTLTSAQRLADAGYVVAVPFIFHWWPKGQDMKVKAAEFRDDWVVNDLKATHEILKTRPNVNESRIGIIGHCWGGRVSWLGACKIPEIKACAIFYGGRIDKKLGPSVVTEQMLSPLQHAKNITCPVAGFFGNEDQNPTPELVNEYERALTEHNVEFTFHRYDAAGHAFQNFSSPDQYREHQSEDAWEKCTNFLNQHLENISAT